MEKVYHLFLSVGLDGMSGDVGRWPLWRRRRGGGGGGTSVRDAVAPLSEC